VICLKRQGETYAAPSLDSYAAITPVGENARREGKNTREEDCETHFERDFLDVVPSWLNESSKLAMK